MPVKRYDPSADLGESYLFDDFPGLLYNNRIWSARGGAGTITIPASCIGGQVQVRGNASNYYELYVNLLSFTVARKFEISWCVKLTDLTSRQSCWGLCGATSPAEAVCFQYDSAVSANWYIVAITSSVATQTDTGIAADTNWHEFRVAGNTGVATYFIDNVPAGNVTTNLPAGSLSPFCRSTSSDAGATKDTLVDWVEVYGDRI